MTTYVMKLMPAILVPGMAMEWLYLESWDLERDRGRGFIKRTADLEKAHKFADHQSAMTAWREQSRKYPYRPDGKPNRPMTAYHADITSLENARRESVSGS